MSFKVIAVRLFNPRDSHSRDRRKDVASLTLYKCKSSDSCEFYKRGECRLFNFMDSRCAHGAREVSTGYTTRSAKFIQKLDDLMAIRNLHKDLPQLKHTQSKMALIGDDLHLPYSHLGMAESVPLATRNGVFSSTPNVIKLLDFTIDVVVKIVEARPQAMMGGEITDFQKLQVPKFVKHLSERFPELYEELKKLKPSLSDLFEKSKSNIGRKAVLTTIKPNVGTFKDIHKATWTWDGEYLTSTNSHAAFMLARKFSEIRIKPESGEVVEITNDEQVGPETVFED